MVINGAIHPNRGILNTTTKSFMADHHPMSVVNSRSRVHLVNSLRRATTGLLAAAVLLGSPAPSEETFSNVPQTLSAPAECPIASLPKDCDKQSRIQKPKSRKAESCTIKCVATCIRGGGGSPGEGPLNVGRPLVVFKEGFRSRRYCLVECSDICNLIKDGDDGP